MANTTKRNTTPIVWPSGIHFTIEELHAKNSGFINITLRFRVKRALENKEIVVIGKIKPAIGRPKLVFAMANPTKELLEAATKAGVLPPLEAKDTSVPVADVSSTPVAPKKKTAKVTEPSQVEAPVVKV